MRILELALKDLQQILRDKRQLIFLVLMPVGFTLFMGIAFKGVVQKPDHRLPLGWYNQDVNGRFTEMLRSALSANPDLNLYTVKPNELAKARQNVANKYTGGVLVIPPGFSDSLLGSQPLQIELIADEYTNLGQSAYQYTRAAVTRLFGSLEIARLSTEALAQSGAALSESEKTALLPEVAAEAFLKWEQIGSSGVEIRLENATNLPEEALPLGGNPYNQTSPGILVQFTIFGLISSSAILVEERKTRTLQRLFTTSMPAGSIVLGHLLANFAVAFGQQLLLVVFGQLFLQVNYLREPAAILLVMIALSLCVSSLGLLISVLARNESQSLLASLILMFVISALGGAWFPLETSGKAFAAVGHLTPGAWAMDGFQNIIIRGQGFASVLIPAAVLLGYALVFFFIGSMRFRANVNAG